MANEILSNVEKRKQYDAIEENWQENQRFQNQKKGNPFSSGRSNYYKNEDFDTGGQSGFSDLFEQFFANQNNQKYSNQKGRSYETEIEITLEEAYQGTHHIIQTENEKLRITTKPGSYDEQELIIKNKGAHGNNEENRGDLFVRIKVKPHSKFIRKGNNLYQNCNIDLYTAILGGNLIVDTLSGQVNVKITEGTQNNKSIRLKGKGMPIYEKPNEFGDLYIQLQVLIPDKLTEKQKELFEELKLTL